MLSKVTLSAALLMLAALPQAVAAPLVFTITGYVQGTGSGGSLNSPFTFTALIDTGTIMRFGTASAATATAAYLSLNDGVTNIPLGNTAVLLNSATGVVRFFPVASPVAAGLGITSSALSTWDFASPIGPIFGSSFFVKGDITTAEGGVISITGATVPIGSANPTFQVTGAVPFISSVSNAASITLPGLPNAGVAQGSIFILKGVGMGPAAIAIASGTAAFQSTTFGGTSVSVTVGATTVKALMYYSSDGQVAALLPSNTPVGTGTVRVNYNSQTSNPVPITVIANNLALFTVDSSGSGPAIVTYPDYSLVTAQKVNPCGGPYTSCGAANPKDVLVLWATGLGPISGSDAAGLGLGQAMPSIPLKLWIGGVQASIGYQGRSGCCVGEDQIVFTVPDNAPTGCAVPLIVQIGNQTSNSTVIPIANGSRNCSPTNAVLANVGTLALAGPINYAAIKLRHNLNGALPPTFADDVKFEFDKILGYSPGTQPLLLSWLDDLPAGTCTVFPGLSPGLNPPFTNVVGINAGTSFSVTGPNGSLPITGTAGKDFTGNLSSAGTFLVPGAAYTVIGTGGPDVGVFAATITYPASPTLVSPANNTSVTRANGMTVTWTGGSGNVGIAILSSIDNTYLNVNSAVAVCIAPASAGTFTIPAYILQALPASTNAGIILAPADTAVSFTAAGIGLGLLQTHNDGTGYGYGAGTGGFGLK
ncbi:MAG: hypothetical protein ABI824_10155 [Acidobacteriota bacterium]